MHGNAELASTRDITLGDLLRGLWKVKWLVVALSLLLMCVAGSVALVLPEQYQASIVVSPASEDSSSRLGGLGAVLADAGGLASSLSGLALGANSQKGETIAILQSEALTEDYIRSTGLLQVLYKNLWDPVSGKWKVTDERKIPTLWKANQLFKRKIRTVVVDSRTGLVTLSIKWKDPVAAATWANDLVRLTNDFLRTRAILESERNIAYLSEQASKTDIVGAKQAIYSILQSEINKGMIARGRQEYALRIIDPATPAESASSPVPTLWGIVGLLSGLLLGVLVVYIRLARQRGYFSESIDSKIPMKT
jgi:uncharacterized protein involved in exopolysaccharide biosynthesis